MFRSLSAVLFAVVFFLTGCGGFSDDNRADQAADVQADADEAADAGYEPVFGYQGYLFAMRSLMSWTGEYQPYGWGLGSDTDWQYSSIYGDVVIPEDTDVEFVRIPMPTYANHFRIGIGSEFVGADTDGDGVLDGTDCNDRDASISSNCPTDDALQDWIYIAAIPQGSTAWDDYVWVNPDGTYALCLSMVDGEVGPYMGNLCDDTY